MESQVVNIRFLARVIEAGEATRARSSIDALAKAVEPEPQAYAKILHRDERAQGER